MPNTKKKVAEAEKIENVIIGPKIKDIQKETIVEDVVEEEPEETSYIPKRYYVQFYKQVEPSNSAFDVVAGTVYWSDIKQDIIIEGLNNIYSSDVEGLLLGDISLANGVFVSRYETPKDWVKNLHKAIFMNGFYAKDFMEIIDETE
jgi:hypothetical protein|tara:strand:- start:1074 stop:1511 length:438 start_codon:yes stop_codon:yes gene_type:complete